MQTAANNVTTGTVPTVIVLEEDVTVGLSLCHMQSTLNISR